MIKKIVLIFTLLLLPPFLFFSYTYHYLQENIKTPSLIFIPKGSLQTSIEAFKKAGVELHWFDSYLLGYYGNAQAGWIALEKGEMSRELFFQKVTHAKAALQNVTLIPGETSTLFLNTLSKNLELNQTKLVESFKVHAPYLEGVLIAETYSVPRGIDEETLLSYLVETSLSKHKKLAMKLLGHYDEKEWFTKIITTASIIQKEAADIDEMPLVSAVIRNRLVKHMKLQMDGTLNYGVFSHVKVSAKKLREDDSAFNTYKHSGLPPYPVCSVSDEAIKAAIYPADVDYLFFVKGKNGKHLFTKSYKEHLKNIK